MMNFGDAGAKVIFISYALCGEQVFKLRSQTFDIKPSDIFNRDGEPDDISIRSGMETLHKKFNAAEEESQPNFLTFDNGKFVFKKNETIHGTGSKSDGLQLFYAYALYNMVQGSIEDMSESSEFKQWVETVQPKDFIKKD